MENQDITIDDLAGMIKRGFDEVTEDHEEVVKILNEHTKKFEEIDETLDIHTEILKEHSGKLDRIEVRLDDNVVDRKEFEALRKEFDAFLEKLKSLENRVLATG